MPLDPHLPVIVGTGQFIQRPADPADALEPVAMMTEAVLAAGNDSAGPKLLSKAQLVVAVKGAWSYPDPARLVADWIGAGAARTALTTDGGNTPQFVLNHLFDRIASGQLDVAVLVGAEGIWSRRRMRRHGAERHVATQPPETSPDETIGAELQMSSDHERARGFEMPVHFYPTFESALRHHRGETIEAHRRRISALWERFNRVAVANPFAWSRVPMTAEQIYEPTPENRMVGFPYTKAMNSNWDLDQGAAVIVCSVEAASSAGVPREKWIFPHAGTDAHDTPLVSNRWSLYESPAIRAAASRLFALAELGVDDLDHVDLYSCFPSAVQIAAAEIGLGEDRDLTVTGGLTFAGGPLNNYVTHSVATMAGVLRSDPGSFGLITANGGYLTKHALAVYSTTPPSSYRHEDVQEEVDRSPSRQCTVDAEGPSTVEAYTVMHGHDGPERALLACLLPDGSRAWANTVEPGAMKAMMEDEFIGRPATISADGAVAFD